MVEVPVPVPRSGEALIAVQGVGLCHSDLLFMDEPEGRFPYPVPFTLGHEIAGIVASVGPRTTQIAGVATVIEPGTPVVIGSRSSCGTCFFCRQGADNYCEAGSTGLGYGQDGGLAEYVVAPLKALVPLTTLEPRQAAPLTDAGKTSYHAVKLALDRMVPGSTTVVLGIGGLGGYAVQYVRLLSRSRLIAVDIAPHRLAAARRLGVEDVVEGGTQTADAVLELTGGHGAEVILDFVGSDQTIATALALARPMGIVVVVGASGGAARVSWTSAPRECPVLIPQGGSMQDLVEVVALAEAGSLQLKNEFFDFDATVEAYRRVRENSLEGRAVVTPDR